MAPVLVQTKSIFCPGFMEALQMWYIQNSYGKACTADAILTFLKSSF